MSSLFGKRRRTLASEPRRPHPDARVETELQRIISLRKVIARKEDLLAEDQQRISALRRAMVSNAGYDGNKDRQAQVRLLLEETQTLDTEIARLHDDIAARVDALTDTDLAWLDQPESSMKR